MASGQILAHFHKLYRTVEKQLEIWNRIHEESLCLLQTAANIIDRLPILQNTEYYGLLNVGDYKQKLVGKQMMALEEILGQVQECLTKLESVCFQLSKASRDGNSIVQKDKRISLTQTMRRFPIPTVGECLEGLSDISKMHSKELKIKKLLTSEIYVGASEEELSELISAYARQPTIDSSRVHFLLSVVMHAADFK